MGVPQVVADPIGSGTNGARPADQCRVQLWQPLHPGFHPFEDACQGNWCSRAVPDAAETWLCSV